MYEKTIHPIDLYAGERLREARKEQGLSQETLAGQLAHPITFQQIQKYERGSNRLSASKMWEFAKALNLPPEFFFPPFTEEGVQCRNAHEARLLHVFRSLSAEQQSAWLALITPAEAA